MALVTGASRGIGRAIAISYAKAGVTGFVLLARSANALDETETAVYESFKRKEGNPGNPKVLKLVVDITDEKEISDAKAQVMNVFGRVDIVVNNAGYLGKPAPIAQTDPGDWWRVWEINMKGTYLITRSFLPLLLDSEAGLKIMINVATNGAFVMARDISAYLVSIVNIGFITSSMLMCVFAPKTGKLAIIRFTELTAAEYGEKGILAITVHPCTVKSDLSSSLPEEYHQYLNDTPEVAGDTITWLSKERRDWLQGRYVDCCWDMGELEARKDEIVSEDKLKARLSV